MLLLDNVVLDINPNKHAAIIKTITLNTFKTVYFNSAACSIITRKYVVLTRKDLVITRKYVVLTRKDLVITRKYVVLTRKDVVLTRKICRFNQKRSRYYEKICRFNEKRSCYNDIIEWKKYYVWAVLCHRNFTLKIFDMDTIGTNHMLLLKLYWQSKKRLEKVLLINVCK